MSHPFLKSLLTILILVINTSSVFGQLTGKLTFLPAADRYLISVIPNQNLSAPQNITSTGQITLKATSGSFDISSIISLNGNWTNATTILSPIESPEYDYHVFILDALLANPNIEAGVSLPLFSFSNKKECQGSIEIVENYADEFWPPNSLNANIGNELTIVGFGLDNAYDKNDELASKIECPKNLAINLSIDTLKCSADSTNISVEVIDGDLPFIYTIQLENGNQLIDSLLEINQQHILKLPLGNHLINGLDQSNSYTQVITINAPPPLRIDIIEKEPITCHNPTGTIRVNGIGGAADNFQYKWSNGVSGPMVNQLTQGFYSVTIQDNNGCSTSKSIFLGAAAKLRIDSVEIYHPTCGGGEDGVIEMLSVANGQMPLRFALDDNPPQKENYFDNLPGGSYQIFVTDAENCVTSKRVTLNTPFKIEMSSLPKDTYLLKGERMLLQPTFTNQDSLSFKWAPNTYLSCDNCPNPTVRPPETTKLTLTVTTPSGCEVTFENQIEVLEKTPIYVPNVFKPTLNDENSQLTVFIGPTIQKIKRLQIFNRWGQLVYSTKNEVNLQNVGWNGQYRGNFAESGIYIYVVEVLLKNLKTEIHTGDFFLKK